MSARERVAIIGAGHNALVCACYLAKAGHDVTVYERRSRVGGAVNTEEMWWEPCDDHKGTGGNTSPDVTCEKCVSHKYLVDASYWSLEYTGCYNSNLNRVSSKSN